VKRRRLRNEGRVLATRAMHAMPVPGQVIGVQWQLDAGVSQAACSIEVRIDDIDFVAL
jgi:hypothetical protein